MCQLLDVAFPIRPFKKPDHVTLFKRKVVGRLLQSEVIGDVSPRRQNRLVDSQLIDYSRFSFQAFCDYFSSIDTWKKSKMAGEHKVNMPRKL